SDVRARFVMIGPVVSRAEVLHPLRRVREAGALAWSARFEQEDGGIGAVHQAPRDHATRRPGGLKRPEPAPGVAQRALGGDSRPPSGRGAGPTVAYREALSLL